MPMADGRTQMTTGRSGCRMSRRAGRRIATATGFMSLTTVGRGLDMSRGDGRRITTGAGCGTEIRGRGGRDRCGDRASIVRSGRRHMFRSLDSEVGSVLDGADSAGFRLGLVTASSRGGADLAGASEGWALIGLAR